MADDFSDDDDDAFLKLCTQSQFSLSQEKENPKKDERPKPPTDTSKGKAFSSRAENEARASTSKKKDFVKPSLDKTFDAGENSAVDVLNRVKRAEKVGASPVRPNKPKITGQKTSSNLSSQKPLEPPKPVLTRESKDENKIEPVFKPKKPRTTSMSTSSRKKKENLISTPKSDNTNVESSSSRSPPSIDPEVLEERSDLKPPNSPANHFLFQTFGVKTRRFDFRPKSGLDFSEDLKDASEEIRKATKEIHFLASRVFDDSNILFDRVQLSAQYQIPKSPKKKKSSKSSKSSGSSRSTGSSNSSAESLIMRKYDAERAHQKLIYGQANNEKYNIKNTKKLTELQKHQLPQKQTPISPDFWNLEVQQKDSKNTFPCGLKVPSSKRTFSNALEKEKLNDDRSSENILIETTLEDWRQHKSVELKKKKEWLNF